MPRSSEKLCAEKYGSIPLPGLQVAMPGNYDLPVCVAEIAAVIGRREAMILAGKICPPKTGPSINARGRAGWIYVPKALTDRLLEVVGDESIAAALVAGFPGELLRFAPCQALVNRHRNEAIRRMIREGTRARVVAIYFDVTERTVRKVCEGENISVEKVSKISTT